MLWVPSFAFGADYVSPSSTCSAQNCAWFSKIGWVNFAPTNSSSQNIGFTISGSAVTGYLWNQNYGWISLSCSNSAGGCSAANWGVYLDTTNGNLSGYAWGENMGWINFSGTRIGSSDGIFSGSFTSPSDIAGQVNFACTNCQVTTSWRPGNGVQQGGPSGAEGYTEIPPGTVPPEGQESKPGGELTQGSSQQQIIDFVQPMIADLIQQTNEINSLPYNERAGRIAILQKTINIILAILSRLNP